METDELSFVRKSVLVVLFIPSVQRASGAMMTEGAIFFVTNLLLFTAIRLQSASRTTELLPSWAPFALAWDVKLDRAK